MKRLIKKSIALTNTERFITRWSAQHVVEQSIIEPVLRENQDCFYSGTVYRILGFQSSDDVVWALNISEEDRKQGFLYGKDILSKLKKLVIIDDKYYSASKSLDGVTNFYLGGGLPDAGGYFIIKFNTEHGLNFEKLMEKYEKISDDVSDMYDEFSDEEEIITQISSDFEVIECLSFNMGITIKENSQITIEQLLR